MCWSRGRIMLNPCVRRNVMHWRNISTSMNMQLKFKHCPVIKGHKPDSRVLWLTKGLIWVSRTLPSQLTTSSGNDDKSIRFTILNRPWHKETNIDEHKECQKDEIHIIVLHVWSWQLVWAQCREFSKEGAWWWLRFGWHQPPVYTVTEKISL